MIVDWYIPADFMYGTLDEDDDKRWPDENEAEREAWGWFALKICDLTGQHEPGHRIVVSIASLTEPQIQCALRDMRARGWDVVRDANLMAIRSRKPDHRPMDQ